MKQYNNRKSLSNEFEDGRSYDADAVRRIERDWLERQMKDRESHFTEPAQVKIFCGTWNVNAKKNEDENLTEWLYPKDLEVDIDMYVIGFQEIVDLTAVNVAVDSKSKERSQFWQQQIENCFLKSAYTLVSSKYLVGILLCVYVKESLYPFVRDVRATTAGVGVMGMMGNKGGVSIHMYLYDSAICLVCAHLAAHRENVAGRNADYHNIIEKTVFSLDTLNYQPSISSPVNLSDNLNKEGGGAHRIEGFGPPDASELSIIHHDLVFWLGDLNYRIDESVPLEEVFTKINDNDLDYLRERDQLNNERQRHHVFQRFEEGILAFNPTYKYQAGTDVYDRRPDKKVRAPAWCDRILWKIHDRLPKESVRLEKYYRAELKSSDHKPVAGVFHCDVRKVIVEKQHAVFSTLMTKLDEFNNQNVPRVQVEGSEVRLDTVYYQIPAYATVRISNIGAVRAPWRFVSKLEETSLGRSYISVHPIQGMLLPNETIDITVTVTVDAKTAHSLNEGSEIIDDIIVLRIENGQDFYVTVCADYARSCYGMSLEELVTTLVPVRTTPSPALRALPESPADLNTPSSSLPTDLSVPKEVWRLVDVLWRRGMKEQELFVVEGVEEEMFPIREALDKGIEFPPSSPRSFAAALAELLSSLPQPLIPPELYPTVEIDSQNIKPWSRRFLENLPPLSYNVFVYLLSFFRELLVQRDANRLTPAKLASASVQFMTRSTTGKDEQTRIEAMQNVISNFLTTSSI